MRRSPTFTEENVAVLLKATHRFKAIPIRVKTYFTEIKKKNFKGLYETQKTLESQSNH